MHRRLDYPQKSERKIVNVKNSLGQISPVGASLLANPFREQTRSYRDQLGNTQWRFKLILTLLLTTPTANAEGLGRLFFTPAQRSQLEQRNYVPSNVTNADSNTPDNGRTLTVNGIVQRNGGKRTVWVNGMSRQEQSDARTPESVTIAIPDQNKSVRLKVGQRVLLSPTTSPNTAKPSVDKQDPSTED